MKQRAIMSSQRNSELESEQPKFWLPDVILCAANEKVWRAAARGRPPCVPLGKDATALLSPPKPDKDHPALPPPLGRFRIPHRRLNKTPQKCRAHKRRKKPLTRAFMVTFPGRRHVFSQNGIECYGHI